MMRKFSIAILFLLITVAVTKAQQVIYSQTFEDTANLFQDYVLSNLDKGDPAGTEWDTLKKVPWFVSTADVAGNHAAIATSNYDPSGAADDWFITPAIRIGKASKLSWKSLSLTAGKTDNYQIYISTTEQSVSGCLFNATAGSYTSNNYNTFVSNTLDLAAAGYKNQTIFIGYRLNTVSGGDRLAIDDLKVIEDSTHFITLHFIVNMANYIADSLFDPRKDTVDIAGNFNHFEGTKNILSIVPGTDSTMYAISISGFLDGDYLEFKFRINSTWNDSIAEFPYGQPNRVWTIQPGKYSYYCFYNDKETNISIVPENKLMDQVKIYPNPAQGKLQVEMPENIDRLLLVNLTGSKILEQKTNSGDTVILDVSSLPTGTYILLFYTDKGFVGSKKLIKN